MSDPVLISMIGGVALVMAAAITGATAYLTSKLTAIHVLMNSRLDELLAATKLSSHAQGVTDEKARADGTLRMR